MNMKFDDLPGWQFETDEVSASVYRVTGMDDAGHVVSSVGTDPEALLSQCREDARQVMISSGCGPP